MSENTNPYDTLFRTAFAEPRAAKDLSLFLLRQAREGRFADATVTVEPESLVYQEARMHRTDLLLEFTWPAPRERLVVAAPTCTCSTSTSPRRTGG